MKILETERLVLRTVSVDDAVFYLQLVNEPSWLQYIGDKGVHTIEDARASILNGPVAMQERFGFSLYLTELKKDGTPIGLCGLIKRDSLQDVDIGFAFLPQAWGKGYAFEAAAAVMAHGKNTFGLKRLVAIASQDNQPSIKLLGKLGLRFAQILKLSDDDTGTSLFVHDF